MPKVLNIDAKYTVNSNHYRYKHKTPDTGRIVVLENNSAVYVLICLYPALCHKRFEEAHLLLIEVDKMNLK